MVDAPGLRKSETEISKAVKWASSTIPLHKNDEQKKEKWLPPCSRTSRASAKKNFQTRENLKWKKKCHVAIVFETESPEDFEAGASVGTKGGSSVVQRIGGSQWEDDVVENDSNDGECQNSGPLRAVAVDAGILHGLDGAVLELHALEEGEGGGCHLRKQQDHDSHAYSRVKETKRHVERVKQNEMKKNMRHTGGQKAPKY